MENYETDENGKWLILKNQRLLINPSQKFIEDLKNADKRSIFVDELKILKEILIQKGIITQEEINLKSISLEK